MGDGSLIVVLAKYPEPGRVKTRLIGRVTDVQASAIHAACLRYTLEIASGLRDVACWLAQSPDAADFGEYLTPNCSARPQGGGDLGDRLLRISAMGFASGFSRIAFVGCDCPTMTADDLTAGLEALAGHDVSIGPAADGGYYLLATRRHAPALFTGIDWSSSRVLQQTIRRADGEGLRVQLLREQSDLDLPVDLAAFLSQRALNDGSEALRKTIEAITNEGETRA